MNHLSLLDPNLTTKWQDNRKRLQIEYKYKEIFNFEKLKRSKVLYTTGEIEGIKMNLFV